MSKTTAITVYAIAWGGKFIGQGQAGVAILTVTDPSGNIVAGVIDAPIMQGNVGGGDGSGDTPAIMRSILWGTPVDKTDAYSYTFNFEPAQPVQLTFTVKVYHNGLLMATASNQQVVWPGLSLSGPTSVVVVLPGLLTNVVAAQNPMVFFYRKPNPISVNVYMMCGCKIDNDYWLGASFQVQAVITDINGKLVETVPLTWSSLATFSGSWTPQTLRKVLLQSFVVETTNGNTACSAQVPAFIEPLV